MPALFMDMLRQFFSDKRGEGVGACGLFHPDIHAHIERMSQSAEDDGRKSKACC